MHMLNIETCKQNTHTCNIGKSNRQHMKGCRGRKQESRQSWEFRDFLVPGVGRLRWEGPGSCGRVHGKSWVGSSSKLWTAAEEKVGRTQLVSDCHGPKPYLATSPFRTISLITQLFLVLTSKPHNVLTFWVLPLPFHKALGSWKAQIFRFWWEEMCDR